jgi:hypothetical protein
VNEDIERSRARVSRRRALALGGTVGLSGLIAACTGTGSGGTTTSASASATGTAVAASGDVTALLARAPQCVMTTEETQGPYWFDVDSIRNDLREDRPGATLDLAIRVQDLYASAPYNEHTGRENNVDNAGDGIFDESGMVTAVRAGDGYLGAINIGV